MEWTQQVEAMYDVRVVPPAPIVFTGNTSCQLTLSYNIEYNLSVVAVTPCGNAIAFTRLNYGELIMHAYTYTTITYFPIYS